MFVAKKNCSANNNLWLTVSFSISPETLIYNASISIEQNHFQTARRNNVFSYYTVYFDKRVGFNTLISWNKYVQYTWWLGWKPCIQFVLILKQWLAGIHQLWYENTELQMKIVCFLQELLKVLKNIKSLKPFTHSFKNSETTSCKRW